MGELTSFIVFVIVIVLIVVSEMGKEKKQKEAHEKVIELIKEGHEAEVCTKCRGRGASFWGSCSECGGMGYTYKLNKEKLRGRNEKK